jgi:hypothetical protein
LSNYLAGKLDGSRSRLPEVVDARERDIDIPYQEFIS